jgi:hypothetical protein
VLASTGAGVLWETSRRLDVLRRRDNLRGHAHRHALMPSAIVRAKTARGQTSCFTVTVKARARYLP